LIDNVHARISARLKATKRIDLSECQRAEIAKAGSVEPD